MIDTFSGGFAFLSNFYKHLQDLPPNTVEHFFQAEKANTTAWKSLIRTAETADKAKKLGRKCVRRPDWEEVKLEVMEKLLRDKFSDPLLLTRLKKTNGEILVEGNYWHDNFWGNCRCEKCQEINGHNHLGRLLMQIRDEGAECFGKLV